MAEERKMKRSTDYPSAPRFRTDRFFVFVYSLVGIMLVLQFFLMFGAEYL